MKYRFHHPIKKEISKYFEQEIFEEIKKNLKSIGENRDEN